MLPIIQKPSYGRRRRAVTSPDGETTSQRGEDGAYYLDYLFGHTVTEFAVGNPEGIRPEDQIEAHRKMIQNAVAKEIHQKSERVKQKYIWLALYHNSTMKRLQERISSENFARFTIPEYLLNF